MVHLKEIFNSLYKHEAKIPGMRMIIPKKENEGIGFTYTVTMEQMQKHAALSPEEVFNWIEETAMFIYELQTPEERERKYIFKPNKKPPPDLLRKN